MWVSGSVLWEATGGGREGKEAEGGRGTIEMGFCPFPSVVMIATGACKRTVFSDSADLRAESPGSASSWGSSRSAQPAPP